MDGRAERRHILQVFLKWVILIGNKEKSLSFVQVKKKTYKQRKYQNKYPANINPYLDKVRMRKH